MRALFVFLLTLLMGAAANADPNVSSFTTVPPGTVMENPLLYAANPTPHSQAYSSVAHLAMLKAAKMSVTTDQQMVTLLWSMPTLYSVMSIYVTNCTTTPAGAIGGIYVAAAKAGTPIVAATQIYTGLATGTAIQPLTNNVPLTAQSTLTMYFSLSTVATTGTPTCDIYVDGIGLQ